MRRVYVEKKRKFDVESEYLLNELREFLGIKGVSAIRLLNRYDFTVSDDEIYRQIKQTILSEPNLDTVYDGEIPIDKGDRVFAVEYLPGQYDQRADSARQCIQILLPDVNTEVKTAKVIVLKGDITDDEFEAIKRYYINPVDSREAPLESLGTDQDYPEAKDIEIVEGFVDFDAKELEEYRKAKGFAMSYEDLALVQQYFVKENRNPTITELMVVDTYWSDHCRHTTFGTQLNNISVEEGPYRQLIESTLQEYLKSRIVTGRSSKPVTLMDLATINAKECVKSGELVDLDISDEINACSIVIDVDENGEKEEWLLMFKNETHNHPTEIEPFGGAATCLGGAIRDPLSGRSYVYQSMRITGSGNPLEPVSKTLHGKLPQRKIAREAARGFSSYGNQVGLATGQVVEIYHQGYVAKRMEVGAVVGAVKKKNVIRKKPQPGDAILLVGGRTGRDGCGGATGSSKAHCEESLATCGAEVQKGNPPEERKIQRLFRNPAAAKIIKRCNDFGAGGVSVAIGELADSIEINLDLIPKKYAGLDGTELAISESQERMAVVVDNRDVEEFIKLGREENLEVTKVATVTDTGRLIMKWRNDVILNLSREFLNSNGAKQKVDVLVKSPKKRDRKAYDDKKVREKLFDNLRDLNNCSQQGLVEMFDSTIGSGTVLMPYGGKYCLTEAEGMAAKIPVENGTTNTCSIMAFGFSPYICEWSPYHGGVYSVVEAISKVVAMGGDYRKVRLSLQEYFERLEDIPEKWGKPLSALLGAYKAQKEFGIAAIGGKDSMSGTFKDISVPPTIIAFAVTADSVDNVVSPEFKKVGSDVYFVSVERDDCDIPDFKTMRKYYERIRKLVEKKVVLSAKTVSKGGVATAVSKMSFGNKIGFKSHLDIGEEVLFDDNIGSLVLEVERGCDDDLLRDFLRIGETTDSQSIEINGENTPIGELIDAWEAPLDRIYPVKKDATGQIETLSFKGSAVKYRGQKIGKPRVFIPVFPGTNCEYDSIKAFKRAGANVICSVFKNLSSRDIRDSLKEMETNIRRSQILMIPGGFSAGDEPDGSGKFIATVFRNPYISDAVMDLLENKDGLILGICNGFQALIKLGLLPYGRIADIDESSPTLTSNVIGRHVSKLVLTKVVSNLSPWLQNSKVGEVHRVPVSHGEGRFVADEDTLEKLIKNGQIATQYVDWDGNATYDGRFNPNGSLYAVEGITSPDGRVLGKMGHSERVDRGLYKNAGEVNGQSIFDSGVSYFV